MDIFVHQYHQIQDSALSLFLTAIHINERAALLVMQQLKAVGYEQASGKLMGSFLDLSDKTYIMANGIANVADHDWPGILNRVHTITGAPVRVNSRDLFEGMLLAIGVEDLNQMARIIRGFGTTPAHKRLGIWRQVLIEDQIRYLETLFATRHPAKIAEVFMTNPQGKKALRMLSRLWKQYPFLELDFSLVPTPESFLFTSVSEKFSVRGSRRGRKSGFQLLIEE